MNLKSHSIFTYFLLCMIAAFLLPVVSHADIEDHIVETGSGFYYIVQKGDTLWDLSEEFSDSPWYWPELWQHNPDIPNPHLIYPGQEIQIYKKTWEGKKEIPVDIDLPEPDQYYAYPEINAVGFIRETKAENYGFILKVKEDMRLISTGDKIYIKPGQHAENLTEGSFYIIYRTSGPVNDPVTGDYIGIQHTITGIAEVIQVEDEFAVATIDSSFRDIRQGDIIMPFRQKDQKIKMRDPVPGLSGTLIKAEDGNVIIGEHMVAFIDKGSNDMVKPGQRYSLYYQESSATGWEDTDEILLTEEMLGTLFVLHTEKTTSTVLITNSKDHISAGTAFKSAKLD